MGAQVGRAVTPAAEHLMIVQHLDQKRPFGAILEQLGVFRVEFFQVFRQERASTLSCLAS